MAFNYYNFTYFCLLIRVRKIVIFHGMGSNYMPPTPMLIESLLISFPSVARCVSQHRIEWGIILNLPFFFKGWLFSSFGRLLGILCIFLTSVCYTAWELLAYCTWHRLLHRWYMGQSWHYFKKQANNAQSNNCGRLPEVLRCSTPVSRCLGEIPGIWVDNSP